MKRHSKTHVKGAEPNPRFALVLALGGGGDVLTSAMFGEYLLSHDTTPILASVAWERFVKDPLPGPRGLNDLTNVTLVGENLARVSHRTAFPNGNLTNQAILSRNFAAEHNFIIDPYSGVTGLVRALESLKKAFPIAEAWGIDVGGDVLAGRTSSKLRSPLADAMLLAALTTAFPAAKVGVFGIGVDGEVSRVEWERNIAGHFRRGFIKTTVTLPISSIARMSKLLDARLVDTEATAMLIRAYQGLHGRFLLRDSGSVVRVDSTTLLGFIYEAATIVEKINMLPKIVRDSHSIHSASEAVEACGYQSELRYEIEKARRTKGPYCTLEAEALRPRVFELFKEIQSKKPRIHFTAERYLAERLKVSVESIRRLLEALRRERIVELHPPFFQFLE